MSSWATSAAQLEQERGADDRQAEQQRRQRIGQVDAGEPMATPGTIAAIASDGEALTLGVDVFVKIFIGAGHGGDPRFQARRFVSVRRSKSYESLKCMKLHHRSSQ